MLHKHHSSHHLAGFILGILLIGGSVGAMSGHLGKNAIRDASALKTSMLDGLSDERRERIMKRTMKRRIRREKRLQKSERVVKDIGVTYPMHTNALSDQSLSRKWEVALNAGFLSYSRLNISAPIGRPSITNWKNRNWRALENQMQYGLMNGLVAYPHSPNPGGNGNLIVAGHSSAPTLEALGSPYEDVFAELPKAEIGDRIEIRQEDSVPYIYEVYETEVVAPTNTSILLQDPRVRDLILFTCYPVGTTRERLIVKARLVEGKKLARM
jgi:LPXTG-site transpeptidase (sortase) family protein